MMLEAYVMLCVAEPDFLPEKMGKSAKNMFFLNLLKNLGFNLFWI